MRTSVDYTLFSMYNEYKATVENPVTYKQYKNFYNELSDSMYNLLLQGHVIPLPCNFGNLKIYKKKPKVIETSDGELRLYGYRPDWKATKDLWKDKYPSRTLEELKQIKNKPIIFHKNIETDGYRCYLDKDKCKLPGRAMIEFNFVRKKNREFNKFIKDGRIKNVEYCEK